MKDKITIIKELKALLVKHFGENIQDVILFGSQAIGKAVKHSDYDILIILKNDYDWKFRDKITDIVYNMELEYDVLFDKHLLSVNEVNNSIRAAQPIFVNAINKGIYA